MIWETYVCLTDESYGSCIIYYNNLQKKNIG